MKVLHVDDDEDCLVLTKKFLLKELPELRVVSTTSAQKALKLLGQHDFDVIVSDYAMPEMNGVEFLEEVRKDMDIPFILFTGKGREEVAMKAMNLGANQYLRKSHDIQTQYRILVEAIIQQVKHYRAQEELEETKERLELALRAARAGWWDYNVETNETVYDERYASMLGYTLDELEPTTIATWEHLCHPEDLKKSDRLWEEHLSGETDFYESEFRMKHKNGEWVWILDRGQIVERDKEGNPVRAAGTHMDITERVKIREKLRESKEAYRSILSSMEDMLFIFDENNIHKNFFASNESLLVSKPKGFLEKHIHDVLPKDVSTKYQKEMEKVRETGKPRTIDYTLNINGEVHWFSAKLSLHENGKDILALVREISDRKKAEKKLQLQSRVLDSIQDLVVATDMKGRITYVNRAVTDMIGKSSEELIGKSTEVLGENPNRGATQQEITETTLREGSWEGNIVNYTSTGKERLLHSRVSMFHDKKGKPLGMVGISSDITEIRRKQQRIHLLNHLLSHDVGNQSHIIFSSLELLKETNLSEEQSNLIDKAIAAIKEEIETIQRIRVLTDIETESLSNVSVRPILSEVVEQKEGLASENDMQIETNIPPGHPQVKAGLLLKPLLTNLVENAIEHSEGTLIRVSYTEEESRAKIAVEDDGKGIPKYIRNEVQNNELGKDEIESSGLGLHLVKWIAQTYKGLIQIGESELGGAAVNVYLQLAEPISSKHNG